MYTSSWPVVGRPAEVGLAVQYTATRPRNNAMTSSSWQHALPIQDHTKPWYRWACKASQPAYDNPALYSADDAFAEARYWDRRYRDDAKTFEWYRGYSSLKPLLLKYFDPEKALLQVGVGTSTIQLDMVMEAGFKRIVNSDYSNVCVEHMQRTHRHVPELEYVLTDARSMPEFPDGVFSGVLDKGTLDALMCGDTADWDAHAMLTEVSRVLAPGGVYMMVTSHGPLARYRFICDASYGWDIQVYEVGQQQLLQGPYKLQFTQDDEAGLKALGLPKQPYSHFAYVCRKRVAQ